MSKENHKAFALPTSPVLMNESAADLDRVRETLNNEIKPRGMIEQLYVLDYAELTFEILRLRRWKMALLNTNFTPALETVFSRLLLQSGYREPSATAKDIAHRWFINKKVKKYGARLLRHLMNPPSKWRLFANLLIKLN